jgi:phosphatidylglycerophosphate synthase
MVNRSSEHVDWDTFRRRCLKPNPERLGTWTARRLGRPAALQVTRVVLRWGMTANHATIGAMVAALGAIVSFGVGGPLGWLVGALLLPLWYLLDHVDGQLARWHRTASLDGTTVDYLMHHSVNMLLPIGLGFGMMRETGSSYWCLAGIAWGWGSLVIGLRHDARYKAFMQRLKLLHGELRVVGGGGGRPEVATLPRPSWKQASRWIVLKAYEAHVVLGMLLLLATVRMVREDLGQFLSSCYVGILALPAPLLAVALVVKGFRSDEAEQEFARWYRVRETDSLEFRDGWWHVEPVAEAMPANNSTARRAASPAHAGVSS